MMYIHMTFSKKTTPPTHTLHSTYLFKIFLSLLTLSTAFLQKASGPGKIKKQLHIVIRCLTFRTKTCFYQSFHPISVPTNLEFVKQRLELCAFSSDQFYQNAGVILIANHITSITLIANHITSITLIANHITSIKFVKREMHKIYGD